MTNEVQISTSTITTMSLLRFVGRWYNSGVFLNCLSPWSLCLLDVCRVNNNGVVRPLPILRDCTYL
jgi:hypothetical protein